MARTFDKARRVKIWVLEKIRLGYFFFAGSSLGFKSSFRRLLIGGVWLAAGWLVEGMLVTEFAFAFVLPAALPPGSLLMVSELPGVLEARLVVLGVQLYDQGMSAARADVPASSSAARGAANKDRECFMWVLSFPWSGHIKGEGATGFGGGG